MYFFSVEVIFQDDIKSLWNVKENCELMLNLDS